MPQTAPILEVRWLLPDGRAGGRHAGGTFKVRGAFPGDRIRVERARWRGRTLEVERWVFVDRTRRTDHPCAIVDRCGGCDLGRIPAPQRREALLNLVRTSLKPSTEPTWIDVPATGRARIKLTHAAGRWGYLEPRSHRLLPVEDCPATHPLLRELLPSLEGHDRPDGPRTLELRTDGRKVVGVLDRGEPADLPGIPHLAVGGRARRGDPRLELPVAGLKLRASPLSFYQVNLEGNERLVARVVENVRRVAPGRIVDLYAGIGNITIPVALALGVPVAAVEHEGQATRDLAHNAATYGLDVEIHTGDARRFDLTQIPFDVAILDPPRAGAGVVLERVLLQRPRAIQLVSCHLLAAARDLRTARKAGYRLTDLAVIDFFPWTHHVETLAFLERSDRC